MAETSTIDMGDGCTIAYRWDGKEGRPVLMLSNSIATDYRMWDGNIDDLTRTHRVLRYDTRGHGRSGAPVGSYSLDRLGRDVLELLDRLQIDRVNFCGLSLGGMIGQWLGVHAPERVDRLILSNTSPYLGPAAQWDALIAGLATRPDMAAMADMFIGNWFPPTFIASRQDDIDTFRRMILSTPAHGLAGCFAAVRDMDMRRTNALIRAPALVIGGTNDTVTLPEHGKQIADAIPGAELVLLPGVHLLNVEAPTEFVDAIARQSVGRDNCRISPPQNEK
ncbi:MAG TPA: alpha/beta fold hydrolase [Sphingopyxis sp.]|uniref:alpha/beta fold hydrolase n=1 Tax=Sphingopyxis sp. TaxID=1908224 RepID=UPI002C5C8E31|nr:alpha/beta fold hydrolase [Sphingopyxis sp.]HWW56281.1 alpha/beta fold hydrolase [Sphingopyxis sp.]